MSKSTPQKVVDIEKYDPALLQDMLPVFYKRLFPHKQFYRWLAYGLSEKGVFVNREISFTFQNNVYMRYLSFESQSEMEKTICSKNPFKIDIGAVMTTRPKNFRIANSSLVPVQRELVFDIDLTDYDDVRTCCSGSNICKKCWKFMAVAAQILDAALREDFGFKHILWVFSGRRGIHCWVCDYIARHIDARMRSSVARYMQIVNHTMVNGSHVPRVYLGFRIHHSIRRALSFIESQFKEIILKDQNLFGTPNGLDKLLKMIRDEKARKDVEIYIRKNLADGAHSEAVWNYFTRYANVMRKTGRNIWSRRLKHVVEEIQLCTLYPRLDINVTKGFKHLLKAPFCIHPATGKLCVPFNCKAAAKFDPTTVPTISQLFKEIDAFDAKSKADVAPEDKSHIKDYKKTTMFKGVLLFDEFLWKLESSLTTNAIAVSDQMMKF